MSYASMETIFYEDREFFKGRLEIQLIRGMPSFETSGLVASSIKESPARLRAAFTHCGLEYPRQRIFLSCLPASRPKQGSHYDLATAVLILVASKQAKLSPRFEQALLIGELSFSSDLQNFRGIDAYLLAAHKHGYKDVILPTACLPLQTKVLEACPGMKLWPCKDLTSCLDLLSSGGGQETEASQNNLAGLDRTDYLRQEAERRLVQLAQIPSQAHLLEGLALAAAGWHPLLILGAPGTGKTYLAETLPAILPALSKAELERQISLAGKLGLDQISRIGQRPFISCHHSVSPAALIGGGRPLHYGLVTAADRGVLFLDELTEFETSKLDLIRQAMSDGRIILARSDQKLNLPADFLLIAAANPCPCGYYLEGRSACSCSRERIERYLGKISGPLWDRFQLFIPTHSFAKEEYKLLFSATDKQNEENIGLDLIAKVSNAWQRQITRAKEQHLTEWRNGRIQAGNLVDLFKLSIGAKQAAFKIADRNGLSARGLQGLLGVARTIADLEDMNDLNEEMVYLAASYMPPAYLSRLEGVV